MAFRLVGLFAAVALLAVATLPVSGQAQQPSQQPQEKRIALVIGNGAYTKAPLATAANDAGLVAQTLQAAGFEVIGARDLDGDTLRGSFRDFIQKGLDTLGTKILPAPPPVRTADDVRALVGSWAAVMGVTPKRVTFREMYRKWGSCSTKGNVTLNIALLHLPQEMVDYVVCHELCHLTVHGHGPAFKKLMASYMPDWVERHKALDKFLRIPPPEAG